MNWKSFIFGAAAGLAGGYLLREAAAQKVPVSGEKILAEVKKSFKKDGPIDGSWLQMKPEDYSKYAIHTKVYRGGITRNKDGRREQFEFIADAYTGTVMDIYPLAQ